MNLYTELSEEQRQQLIDHVKKGPSCDCGEYELLERQALAVHRIMVFYGVLLWEVGIIFCFFPCFSFVIVIIILGG